MTSSSPSNNPINRMERSLVPMADVESVEIRLLLEGVFHMYGYDFREYSYPSIRRRIHHRLQAERLLTVSQLMELVLRDPSAMSRLLRDLTIPVTEMFRDPSFFLAFREKVVPVLRQHSRIRIWHAGCSTGEEVYSMSILLREEGLASSTTLYATDLNSAWLSQAKQGIYDLNQIRLFTYNYLRSGGSAPFSDYYTVIDGRARIDPELSRNIFFSTHNLAIDQSFNEFHVIICRNVLIYFNPALQRKVIRLFQESLIRGGFLALGSKESLMSAEREFYWEEYDPKHRIYRNYEHDQ